MKKLIAALLMLVMAFSLVACGASNVDTPAEPAPSGNTGDTPSGGNDAPPAETKHHLHFFGIKFGDLSFNDAGWAGCQDAAAKYGWECTFTELGDDTSTYESAFVDVLDEGEVDIVVTQNNYGLGDLCQKYADAYPDITFIYFDSARDIDLSPYKNVYGIAFESSESCFLAGALAGKMSKTGKVGAFIFNEVPGGFDFVAGYLDGLKYANPDAKLFLTYGDGTKGPDVLYEIANAMMDAGADFILGGSGRAFSGLVQAMTERGGVEAGLYAFGPDTDMYASYSTGANAQYADVILTSTLKGIHDSVLYALDCYTAGTLECGKVDALGIVEGGAGIADNEHYRSLVPEDVAAYIDGIIADVKAGNLDITSYYDFDSVEAFKQWCDDTGMIATY